MKTRLIAHIVQCLLIAILCTGCATYKRPTTSFLTTAEAEAPAPEIQQRREKALNHWLYKVIPRHRSQIRWYDLGHWVTWTLFGNDDDGIFGEEPTSGYKTRRNVSGLRAFAWTLRNPLHNLGFYVLGSANRENSEFALVQLAEDNSKLLNYKAKADTVFAGEKSSFFLGFHGWKPFLSLRLRYGRQLDFYFGWRERGNFGMKFIPFKKVKGPKAPPNIETSKEEQELAQWE